MGQPAAPERDTWLRLLTCRIGAPHRKRVSRPPGAAPAKERRTASPGIPHPRRGREADKGRARRPRPLCPPGRHADPDRLSAGLRATESSTSNGPDRAGRSASLHVRRLKNGKPSVHPLRGDEVRACASCSGSSPNGLRIRDRARRAIHLGGREPPDQAHRRARQLPFPVHVHMLRHACGYALANAGHDTRALQDWLGHRNIQHTVRYTELSPTRFKDFWR